MMPAILFCEFFVPFFFFSFLIILLIQQEVVLCSMCFIDRVSRGESVGECRGLRSSGGSNARHHYEGS